MNAQPWREDGGAAPRRVDVEPQVFRSTEPRQIRKRVDGARRGGAGRPDHHDRREPVSTVLCDASGEICEIHPPIAVGRHRPQRAPSDPRHVRDLVERVVGFAGQVDRRRGRHAPKPTVAVRRERPRQCDDDG